MNSDKACVIRVKGPSNDMLNSVSRVVGAVCTSSPEWTGRGLEFLVRFGSVDDARGALVRARRILDSFGDFRAKFQGNDYMELTYDSVTAKVENLSAV